jgi:hypothetical protein
MAAGRLGRPPLGAAVPRARAGSSRWDVYRLDGVLLGAVSMAPGLSPVEIGVDYVLGLATGERLAVGTAASAPAHRCAMIKPRPSALH